MAGTILVTVAFAFMAVSALGYVLSHLRPWPTALAVGRRTYQLGTLAIVAVTAVLLTLILSHQFQYSYVWSYSSRDLSLPLLVSTLYAGQEGSFLLWTLFTSLIGLILIRHSARMGYEPQVMSVFALITLTLSLMLLAKNPFLYVWENWPGEVSPGFVPPDGRGLNPLLQNYWMVIHPQVLFLGFASMAVPYAYAMGALMKRDYAGWIKPAAPWMAFSGLILGLGIMLGGYWAYETLGWGGYWAWDPVENSSFVPWLVGVAALHTTLSQRKTGGFMRTNLVLSMLAFILVLYSTFLTRSGVLGDTSVHSFVDPGMWVYWLLISLIVLFVGIAVALLLSRWKEIPWPAAHRQSTIGEFRTYMTSREFALFLGASTLFLLAVVVLWGTSTPIITDLLEGKKSAIDISFYARWSIPLGIAIGVLSGLAQLLWWSRSERGSVLRSLRVPVTSAAAGSAVFALLGVTDVAPLLVVAGALFALVANAQVALRVFRGNPKFMGGAVAHVGIAIMVIGFVISSEYDSEQTVSLVQGTPLETMGYRLTYEGYRPLDGEKYAFNVKVEREGRTFTVAPVMYYSSYTEGLMRNPDILNRMTHDFYLAPMSLEQPSTDSSAVRALTFRTGESQKVGELNITFLGFSVPEGHMGGGTEAAIGARLSVARYGSSAEELVPAKRVHAGRVDDVPATFEGRFEFAILGMTPDTENRRNSSVQIAMKDLARAAATQGLPDILVAEASVKPSINLVWAGLILVLVGFGITVVRRAQEASLRAQRSADVDS
jgi:cytochrome c-type biogenesis protein CcmF